MFSTCSPIANFDIENSYSDSLTQLYRDKRVDGAQRFGFRNLRCRLLHECRILFGKWNRFTRYAEMNVPYGAN
jgi:hypothetical protein